MANVPQVSTVTKNSSSAVCPGGKITEVAE